MQQPLQMSQHSNWLARGLGGWLSGPQTAHDQLGYLLEALDALQAARAAAAGGLRKVGATDRQICNMEVRKLERTQTIHNINNITSEST